MHCKSIIFTLVLMAGASLSAEIIHLSHFKQKREEFHVTRNLFSSSTASRSVQARRDVPPDELEQETVESLRDTLNKSIQFNGYIQSGDTLKATLSISGEFYMVGEGETILDRIKILKITKEKITIEYEGQPFDIEITKGF